MSQRPVANRGRLQLTMASLPFLICTGICDSGTAMTFNMQHLNAIIGYQQLAHLLDLVGL